jgi:succinate dehydrogenase / fumarate reductase cytochrome b subunit
MQATETPSAEKSCCDCRVIRFLESSIGKKMMVAVAGLLLCGFLITHLLGNLLLFVGAGAFNKYASTLEHNPLLPLAEIGLAVLFLIHIALSVRARLANMAARPTGYQVTADKGARTPGSRSMAISGSLILLFLIVHLKTFRFAAKEMRESDMYQLVTSAFTNPLYAGFYVLALIGLGLHLSHGFQSGFQTLGLNHPRYSPLIRKLGLAFAILVALGFASMPVYFGFLGGAK